MTANQPPTFAELGKTTRQAADRMFAHSDRLLDQGKDRAGVRANQEARRLLGLAEEYERLAILEALVSTPGPEPEFDPDWVENLGVNLTDLPFELKGDR